MYALHRRNGVWSIFHLWLVELAHVEMQGLYIKYLNGAGWDWQMSRLCGAVVSPP